MNIPVCVQNCKDVHCKNQDHLDQIDEFVQDILETVEEAASEELPVSQHPKPSTNSKPISGWIQSVKPFKDTAYFWHQVWVSAGRPINTQLHKIMKRTRNVGANVVRANARFPCEGIRSGH